MCKFLKYAIALACLFLAQQVPGSGVIIDPYRFASGSSSALLLDETGLDSAHAAYSVARKLRAAYSGSAIRVRRSSDDAEQDIGFSSDVLDESALTTFVGANDGYVVTLYDQSGNGNDATQATEADQSQIVSSGTVVKNNSKPALSIDSGDHYVATGSAITANDEVTLVAVSEAGALNGYLYLKEILHYGQNTSDGAFLHYGRYNQAGNKNKPGLTIEDTAVLQFGTATTDQTLMAGFISGTAMSLYVNDSSEVSTTSGSALDVDNDTVVVMGSTDPTLYSQTDDYWQEGIVWEADLEVYVSTIKSNVNGFYSIY